MGDVTPKSPPVDRVAIVEALYAELRRQADSGAGEIDADAETGLITVSADLDLGGLADAALTQSTSLLREERDRLREALRPFAEQLFPRDDWDDDLGGPETMAAAGWVRQARKALAPTAQEGGAVE